MSNACRGSGSAVDSYDGSAGGPHSGWIPCNGVPLFAASSTACTGFFDFPGTRVLAYSGLFRVRTGVGLESLNDVALNPAFL